MSEVARIENGLEPPVFAAHLPDEISRTICRGVVGEDDLIVVLGVCRHYFGYAAVQLGDVFLFVVAGRDYAYHFHFDGVSLNE